jgi:protein deglycase
MMLLTRQWLERFVKKEINWNLWPEPLVAKRSNVQKCTLIDKSILQVKINAKSPPMKKILLLLADGFEIFEASVFFDVLGWNLVEGDGTTKVIVCGMHREIKSTFGATMIADITVDQINVDDYAALAVPGGFGDFNFYDEAYSEPFLDIIRKFNAKNKTIASICTGALPVGKSGILAGRTGTTYNQGDTRQAQLREFGVTVLGKPIVEDGNVITSWNPSTAMEVAFTLLERLTNAENTKKVRGLMGFH